MSSLAIIIPVKATRVKSRLSDILSEKERAAFASLLLADLLGTLSWARLLAHCKVVSSDRRVLSMARRMGATPVPEESDSGVDSAVYRGISASRGSDEFLVLPSDIPTVAPSDLEDLNVLKRGGSDVVLAPSRAFDGTNALMFPGGRGLPLSYDRDSFWSHLASTARLGLRAGISCRQGLMFDVDSPEDFRALALSRDKGSAARFARRALTRK